MVADITTEPLGEDSDGNAVYLRDIWPTAHEVTNAVARHVTGDMAGYGVGDLMRRGPDIAKVNGVAVTVFAKRFGRDVRDHGTQ